MKIEFGPGLKGPKEGGKGCDIRPGNGIQYVCSAWQIPNFIPEGSVDQIYSRHMFEHLTFRQGYATLLSWRKVLKTKGRVHLIIPDLAYHVNEYVQFFDEREDPPRYTKSSCPSFIHSIAGFYGWQRESEAEDERFSAFENDWDVHKSGYDELLLKQVVEKAGFTAFLRRTQGAKEWDLDVSFNA